MPVKIRLSRSGSKKRPYYKIVVADSRRSRDGKYLERIGSYNPMLPKANKERIKIDIERAKHWLSQGAKPTDRLAIFLGNMEVINKPIITKKTKKHLPKVKKGEEKNIVEWKMNRAVFFSRSEKETWHSYKGDGKSNRVALVYNLMTKRIKDVYKIEKRSYLFGQFRYKINPYLYRFFKFTI